ncbi:MAG: type II toxin-antitoxin system Phd/YefM family antitoxin [Caldilineaceae bacterium]|nr:type II toxin-antitoxin system Phd/YefM family antitoxin [Caldilineaceae bacterium]MBP8109474.1 type II toxin-antitoxin system Phd/YefM family antitoxin [Caldilineaceae bacterium]MBP8124221.1 type II toxin-antitoxin system Phd/YefM family antitoxin [Caldilineaceae bacterium]MBP9073239.1 type II toxin-antitoxin system Phd/YefM family antitoxin [Caldilineaceae bacterium]
MQKVIGVTELQRNFRKIFDEVKETQMPYVLFRGSRPEAALISYADFEQFQALRQQAILARFDQVLARMEIVNADFSDEEIAADVAAAREEID